MSTFLDEMRAAWLAKSGLPHKPWRGPEPERTQQRKLLDGMDCLAGQLDLFDEQRPEPQPTDLPT
ncbi:MAG: hypothetical protein ABSF26_09785 [Thermoguttaceae bacterium]|jgi:hypothetical protein